MPPSERVQLLLWEVFLVVFINSKHHYVSGLEVQQIFKSADPTNNFAVNEVSNKVYLASVNRIYQLDGNLSLEIEEKTGPVLDNMLCHAPQLPHASCEHPKVLTDNYNKLLQLDRDQHVVVVCGSVYQGFCELRKLENVSEIAVEFPPQGDHKVTVFPSMLNIAANHPNASTVGLILRSSGGNTRLLVGATYTGVGTAFFPKNHSKEDLRFENTPEIAIRSLNVNELSRLFTYDINPSEDNVFKIKQEVKPKNKLSFVQAFIQKTYSYIAMNNDANLGEKESQPNSILARICLDNKTKRKECKKLTESYIQMGLQCGSDGSVFNRLLSVFSARLQSEHLDCGAAHLQHPLALRNPLKASPVFESSGLTAVAVASVNDHTIVFLGTATGRLQKLNLLKNLTLGSQKAIRVASRESVHHIMSFDPSDNNYLYLMTSHQMIRVKVAKCDQYKTCNQCLGAVDAYCGWCTLESRCSLQRECTDWKQPHFWISLSEGIDMCPSMTITPSEINLASDFKGKNVGILINGSVPDLNRTKVECDYGNGVSTEATVYGIDSAPSQIHSCPFLPKEKYPEFPPGQDHVTIRTTIKVNGMSIVWGNVTIYDCERTGMFNAKTACTSCLNTKWKCYWNVKTYACVSSNLDSKDLLEDSASCPKLIPATLDPIASGTTQDIIFSLANTETLQIEPLSGPLEGGTLLTIQGRNLGRRFSDITVSIGGVGCRPLQDRYIVSEVRTQDTIKCTMPAALLPKAETVQVCVQFEGNPCPSSSNSTMYTYMENPVISEISPKTSHVSGGRILTLKGQEFNLIQNISMVVLRIGKEPTICAVQSPTVITCPSPAASNSTEEQPVKFYINGVLYTGDGSAVHSLPDYDDESHTGSFYMHYCEDPHFYIANKERWIKHHHGEPLTLVIMKARNCLDLRPEEYKVMIGSIPCEISFNNEKVFHCTINGSLSSTERQLPVININVSFQGCGMDSLTVRVMNTDTICQVKEKILEAFYKNLPFSQWPRAEDLDLEWFASSNDSCILRDLDDTTLMEDGRKKLNTVLHYKNINVSFQGCGMDSLTVRVMNTDTICQVKEKILEAFYKNLPFSQWPRAEDLDLEWFASSNDSRILRDLDDTTLMEDGRKKLNTVLHYKVPEEASLAISLKDKRDNTLGRVKDLDTEKYFHLVLPNDELMENKKSHRQGHRKKVLPEIYLTRLLSTKGTLQKFLDDLFQAILSIPEDKPPFAVKYFFDFLEEQADKRGITDPDTLHIWKTNSLPLRFWVNILKNPQFVFDIDKTDHMDACLSVIAQAFIDACSISDLQLGKDSPTNKLLYAKEIPEYKKTVQRYYQQIQEMMPLSEQEMNAHLAEESRKYRNEFNTNSALAEIYKYAKRYQTQVVNALEANPTTKRTQLQHKFQQVIALVEDNIYECSSEA
ncbi:Plexin-D1 [Acipenser ruthenus]|uniref:Plexin-D1 n=1 Tax=Acipenser ruthenus TaxID=7906 RepID=A0A444V759_ACIRT|nr:Plexin-D1 [Acipenser ruthenus]